jgi:hypothetical protein
MSEFRERQPDGIHTIPVPPGWSAEQAWEHIVRGVLLPTDYPEHQQRWMQVVVANIEYGTDGNVCAGQLVEVLP